MYLYIKHKNKWASWGNKKSERRGGKSWQGIAKCTLCPPLTCQQYSTPITVNSLREHRANQPRKASSIRNVTEWHNEILSLGIWEGKMQVAWESQTSEKQKGEDQAPDWCFSPFPSVTPVTLSPSFGWAPIYTTLIEASDLVDTHCCVKCVNAEIIKRVQNLDRCIAVTLFSKKLRQVSAVN